MGTQQHWGKGGYSERARMAVEGLTIEGLTAGVAQVDAHVDYKPTSLRHRYLGLRHGQSEANLESVISSCPVKGSQTHGLTPLGQQQARQSSMQLLEIVGGRDNLKDVIFMSSNFTRAWQTAEQCAAALVNTIIEGQGLGPTGTEAWAALVKPAVRVEELRERSFGEFDGLSLEYYNLVWPVDSVDASNVRFGVESVNSVMTRVSRLIQRLEKSFPGEQKTFVWVSHADTLQIANLYLCWSTGQGCDPRLFHSYRFKNGEVRDLLWLPEPVPLVLDGVNK